MFYFICCFYSLFKRGCFRNFILWLSLFLISNSFATENVVENTTESAIESSIKNTTESDMHLIEKDKNAKDTESDYYIGVLIGTDELKENQILTEEEVAKLNLDRLVNRDSTSEDYISFDERNILVDESNILGALLIGKELRINGALVELKFDEIISARKADTEKFKKEGDPEEEKWFVTARADIKQKLESITLSASGGLAIARLNGDSKLKNQPAGGGGNHLSDNSNEVQLGWVVGLGAEIPLSQDVGRSSQDGKDWFLRIEGTHIKLEEKGYTINPSGFEGETNNISLFLIHRF